MRKQRTIGRWGWGVVLAGCLLVALPAGGQEPRVDSASGISDAQRQQIETASEPARLLQLAQDFAFHRQHDPARLCVAKACEANNDLWTDTTRQSPRSWNEFWFAYRAELREAKLAEEDAAGRTALAIWLYEAGVQRPARQMLRRALEIDPLNRQARELAQTWNLFGGQPLRFDLSYALTHPLLLDSVTDEEEVVTAEAGSRFMLLPFAYEIERGRLSVAKTSVVVTADGKERCSVLGLMLLAGGRTEEKAAGGAKMKLQAPREPVWERIQIGLDESQGLRVTGYNLMQPPGKMAAAREARRAEGGKKSSSRDRRGMERTVAASGYAVFVVEVPASVQRVEAVYRSQTTIRLETALLEVLGQPAEKMPAGDRAKFLDVLAEKVSAPNPLIASAAVAKLHLIRKSVEQSVSSGRGNKDDASALDAEAYRRIEEILLGALRHVESQVFQEAFNSLVLTELPLSDATLLQLTQPEQVRVAMALLDGIEQSFEEVSAEDEFGGGRSRSRSSDERIQNILEWMPEELRASPLPGNVFWVLGACLYSSEAKLAQRALDILLADGSQESVIALIDIPASSRALLAKAFREMDDGPLKEAILRVFLTGPESALTPELFAACKTLNLRVVSEQDPLFKALLRRPGPELQVRLLELLVSADVQKILQTESFERVLGSLALDAQRSKDLQRILLKLALDRFEADYQMPLPSRQVVSRGRRDKVDASLYEMILVELATTEGVDPEVVRQAGGALFGAGRIAKFKERFDGLPTVQRQVELIQFFSADKALFERQAWPVFLAGCLDQDDPQTSKAALEALAVINQSLAEENRWLLTLAIKLGVNSDELVELTLSAEPDLARQAMSLLRQLVHMSAAESQAFEALTDPAERMKNLAELEKRTIEFAAGKFNGMIYLDLNIEEKKSSRKADDEGRSRYQPLRLSEVERGRQEPTSLKSVPLPSSTLTLRHDGLQVIRASAGRRDLLLADKDKDDKAGELIAPATTFRLDVAPLVLEGLKIASRRGQSFARQVDQYPLSERVSCEFKHLRFGVWEGVVRRWPMMKKSDRGSVWTMGEAMFYLEPLESLRDAPRPIRAQRGIMMMRRANEKAK